MYNKNIGEKNVVGLDKGLKDAYSNIKVAAKHPVNVLITGETGTGKEVVASLIHELSNRKDRPFIKINCAALPNSLFESELFGVEKGAYTDAKKSRAGKMELANGGTLFLDEIGELDLDLQAKLLRVLQTREIERLGSNKIIKTNFRLIVATNRNLRDSIKNRQFRNDLYYRLNEFPVTLPPLRERKMDISALATFFITKISGELGLDDIGISSDALDYLKQYQWPGNVREFENVVKRVIISLENTNTIKATHFKFLLTEPHEQATINNYQWILDQLANCIMEKKIDLKGLESDILNSILKLTDHNIMRASRISGIARNRFYRRA